MKKSTAVGLPLVAVVALAMVTGAWGQNPVPVSPPAATGADTPNPKAKAAVRQYMTGPSVFIENAGQWADASIKFALDGTGANVGLTDKGPRFQLFRREESAADGAKTDGSPADPGHPAPAPSSMHEFALVFDGAPPVCPVGRGRSDRKFNYLLGNAAGHREDVGSFNAVWYENLYPGVSLELTGERTGLKYNFHVAPGADPKAIRLRYEQIEGLRLTPDDALEIRVKAGWEPLTDGAPYLYQEVSGEKRAVTGRFVLFDEHTYGFEVTGARDETLPLVIDPSVAWGTYLGGTENDYGQSIEVDTGGNCYATGYTLSSGWVSGGWDTSLNSNYDGYVVKLSATGAHLWSTYLGGTGDDYGFGITVDTDGNSYATGYTLSSGWVSGGWDTSLNGNYDGYVVKLSAAGAHLWSTYLGGIGDDYGESIAVDTGGNCYATGYTRSPGWVSGGWDTSQNGVSDGCVVKLSAAGEHLWSTYLGGTGEDYGYGIAVDSGGDCYITGTTASSGWVSGGWDTAFQGGNNGYVVKLSAAGEHLWSTYLGGTGGDGGYGIAVDFGENCYVTGYADSIGWVNGGWDTSQNGGSDGYVVKLSAAGEHLWSTYLGGTGEDRGRGIAVDSGGNCYATGYTASSGWVSGGWNTALQGANDGYVVKLSAAGEHLWSTYLGGTSDDRGYGIAVDSGENCYATGYTASSGWVSGGWDTSQNGGSDCYVVKIEDTGETGNLQVSITPSGALSAGAQWRPVTSSTWFNSGETISGLAAGEWAVEFKDVCGHVPPEVHKISVPSGGIATDTGVYTAVSVDVSWSTYLGGTGTDEGCGIAVDSGGNCLVTGYTQLSGGWISGGWDTSPNAGYDGYVVKLSAAGAHLWSTFLGGTGDDWGYGVAVDAGGNCYATGFTASSGWVSGGWDTSQNGDYDGYVVKLSAAGVHLWSTYLGGTTSDYGHGIAVDSGGNCFVTGSTASSGWVSGGYDTSQNGNYDGYVVKLSAAGMHLWSTYLGGTTSDYGYGIAVDSTGDCCVTGSTTSNGWVSGGWKTTYQGGIDGYVAKLSAVGEYLWSTYLGGPGEEQGRGIAVDLAGDCYATGETFSSGWVNGGCDTNQNGSCDGYVVKLSPAGSHLWSTYMGGMVEERGYGIAVDSAGNCYATGSTYSSNWVNGGYDTSKNGNYDVYVVKLSAAGAHLWSTYLGGKYDDEGRGVAMDATGTNIWVTGCTRSSGWVSNGWKTELGGDTDAFVMKIVDTGETGSLQVTMAPSEAVSAGAQWRLVASGTWNNSGDMLEDLAAGAWLVEFKDLYGWAPSEVHTVSVPPGGGATYAGVYAPVPVDMSWSTFLGGTESDQGYGIAVDADGNCYSTGYTSSSGWVSGGVDTSWSGGYDGYVVKLSAAGEHLWSTFLGGTGNDQGHGIAVDTNGDCYATGYTASSGWVSGGVDTSWNGGCDGYVVKLSAAGAHLWSTYLGGTGDDQGHGIAVDTNGDCYATGHTASSGWVSGGWDTSRNGDADGYVVKLSASGAHLWSTYLGGTLADRGYGIAVDTNGNCYATGETYSSGWVNGGWDTTLQGTLDGFVVKLNAAGGYLWSTYLGGASSDYGLGIAVDTAGNCYATGVTYSASWVSGGGDTSWNGGYDGYLVKLSAAGAHLWSTFLGGTGDDRGYGVAVDTAGNCYATGDTRSSAWVSGGGGTTLNSGVFDYSDAFVVKLSPAGAHLWSQYLGGINHDYGQGIAVDASGANIWVTGYTVSDGWVINGWQTAYRGGAYDAFVAKIVDHPVPIAPGNPGSTAVGMDTITWTWTDNATNETGFKVYDDPGAGPPVTLQTTTTPDLQQWQHNGLNVNTQYAFQVAATNAYRDSDPTPNFTAWTLIEAVSGLGFSNVGSTGVDVTALGAFSNLSNGNSGLYYENTTVASNSGWVQDTDSWNSGGLTPNTLYTFTGQSRNGGGAPTVPVSASKYTLAEAPSAGNNVACDKSPGTPYPAGTTFTFSNPAGFGAGTHGGSAHMVSKFKCLWDTNPTHAFAGTESGWNSGTVAQSPSASGSYYLHVQSFNGEDIDSGTLDYGPFLIDTVPPTPVISGAATLTNASRTLTIDFGEVVDGFAIGMVSVDNGAAANLQPVDAAASYTVDILGSGTGTVSVSVAGGVVTDQAGNANLPSAPFSFPFDDVAPTPVISGAATLTNASRTLTIDFGEVVDGFAIGMVSVDNGLAANLQPAGAAASYTVDILGSGTGTVSVSVAGGVVTDQAGNANLPSAPFSFPFDDVAPTATITLDDPSPTEAEVVRFSVNFSESVGGTFTEADISLSGTLAGTPVLDGTDPNYTVTVTLTLPEADGTVGISLGTGMADAAGNTCAGGASPLYAIENWPGFTTEPSDAMKYTGDDHAFTAATGAASGMTTCQWKWDDGSKTVHDGPTAPAWALTGLTPANQGQYWCEVTHLGVTHTTRRALLSVADHLSITVPPSDGQAMRGESHTFAVEISGGYAPHTYEWKKDGNAIPGATEASHTCANLAVADSGTYTVEVTDGLDDFQSASAELLVTEGLPVAGLAGLAAISAALCTAVYRRRSRE